MTMVFTIFEALSVFILVALHELEIFIIQLFLYKEITSSIITTNSIAFIFTRYLSILNVLSIYVNDRKFAGEKCTKSAHL